MRSHLPPSRVHRDRWLLSYADLVTLLLACFTTTYAAAQFPAATAEPAAANVTASAAAAPAEPTPAAAPTTAATADAPPRESTLHDLLAPLAAASDGRVTLVEDQRGLVLSLPESATFPTGSAALTADARRFLDQLALTLAPTGASVRVEGHTDTVPVAGGRFGSNWELSTARASAVVVYLIDRTAFDPTRLSAAGYGEFHPRAANDTAEHRALNRRVDVVVSEEPVSRGREDAAR